MPLTDDEIQMLTALTVRCRPLHSHRWDPAGTMAAIRRVANRTLPSVMRACAAAAADPKNRTPGVIPQPGAHWRDEVDVPFARTELAALCVDCGRENGPAHPQDHPWRSLKGKPGPTGYGSEPAARARALARAAKAGVALEADTGAGSAP